ncbi:AraC family transcriptional regulator [Jeotgalibaca caeni]|uniref:AraC family transcriptional regulator n=1 Tax=Jeotgalibaca caeni TaxID=3028623 RepID=UPI00237D9602|nr:AraC family transcriptional regulator [Jeotgalibaca caeni]MDE1549685.1 AraC family transcriptional regulator [Jeotgalibaca caeni]
MKKKEVIELRSYQLQRDFPVLLLTGEKWRISDIPSDILHFHNCTEIGICYSDHGIIVNNGGKHPFRAGDVTFITSDVAHTTYSAPNTFSKWSYIFVNLDELLFPYFSSVLLDCSVTEALNKISINFFTIISENTNPYYNHLVKLMVQVLEEEKPNYKTVFRSLMLAFVMNMMNEGQNLESIEDELDIISRGRIDPALHYIQKHYQDYHLTIEQLAQTCNLSLTHFRRLFQSAMNVAPLDYVNLIRIKAGMKRLTTTNDAVITIAEEVGFRSISSFNRQFLKRTGVTPSEWRKNNTSISQGELIEYNGWMEPPKYP